MGHRGLPQVLFDNAINTLKNLIIDGNHVVAPNVNGNVTVATIAFYIGGNRTEFAVHADCKIDSIRNFIQNATSQNICIALGDRNGRRLGINGSQIEGLYIYYKP